MQSLNVVLIICVLVACTQGRRHGSRDKHDDSSEEERAPRNRSRYDSMRGYQSRGPSSYRRPSYGRWPYIGSFDRRGYRYGPYHDQPSPVRGPCNRTSDRPGSKLNCRIEEIINASSVVQEKADAFRDEFWRIMVQEWTNGNTYGCGRFSDHRDRYDSEEEEDTYDGDRHHGPSRHGHGPSRHTDHHGHRGKEHHTTRPSQYRQHDSREEEDQERRPSSYKRGRDHDHARNQDHPRDHDHPRNRDQPRDRDLPRDRDHTRGHGRPRDHGYPRDRDHPRDHDHPRDNDHSRHRDHDHDRRDGRYDDHHDYHHNTTRDDYEQVPYERVCSPGSKYDIRMYSAAKWISTFVNTSSVDAARFAGYKRMKCYRCGNNLNQTSLNKTVPIRISISTGNKAFAPPSLLRPNDRFLVSSYIPIAFQQRPPHPHPRSQIRIGESAEMQVFAFNFSGNASGETIYEKYFEFLQILDEDEQEYVSGDFMVHLFDAPWIPAEERHNEILIPVRPNATQENICKYPNGIRQCARSECPVYETVETIAPNIIVRRTEPGVYATKKSATCLLRDAVAPYMDIHKYFAGNNTENAEMNRTTPLLRWAARPSKDITGCNFTYELSFYLPKAFHKYPPTPIDKAVAIVRQDQPTYDYVIIFEGLADDATVHTKYRELVAELKELEYCFDESFFEYAQYDHSMRPQPHRHEVSIPVSYSCNEVQSSDVDILI